MAQQAVPIRAHPVSVATRDDHASNSRQNGQASSLFVPLELITPAIVGLTLPGGMVVRVPAGELAHCEPCYWLRRGAVLARTVASRCRRGARHCRQSVSECRRIPSQCTAETLARVQAECDRREHQLWRVQAQIEACTLRLYRMRERFKCAPEQLLLPFANDPELEAEFKAAAEYRAV